MKRSIFHYSALHRVMLSFGLLILAAPASASELASRLYQVTGMQSQLESMSAAFDQGFGRLAKDLPEKTLKDMIQIGKDSFDESTMAKIIVAHLDDKLTADQMQKVLDWHSTKLAEKITRLENDAATPEGQQKLMAYAQQLAAEQPKQAYVTQIQELAVASKAVDLAVEIAANMQFSMGAGMAMATANDETVDLKTIAAEIEKAKPQLQQQLSRYILVSMLYTYQGLSEQELNSYIKFVSSPTGEKFHTAMFGGLNEAFIKVGKRYGKALGEYFERDAKQSNT